MKLVRSLVPTLFQSLKVLDGLLPKLGSKFMFIIHTIGGCEKGNI